MSKIYSTALWVAAIANMATLVTIILSIVLRIIGISVGGLDAYAGYFLATTFFLAMAQTFIKNEHIRVNILLSRLKQPFKKFLEVFIHLAAIFIVSYLTYFSIRLAYFSFKFNDISQLPDATPLWIPQISFGLGSFVFLLAIIENLINIIKDKGN